LTNEIIHILVNLHIFVIFIELCDTESILWYRGSNHNHIDTSIEYYRTEVSVSTS